MENHLDHHELILQRRSHHKLHKVLHILISTPWQDVPCHTPDRDIVPCRIRWNEESKNMVLKFFIESILESKTDECEAWPSWIGRLSVVSHKENLEIFTCQKNTAGVRKWRLQQEFPFYHHSLGISVIRRWWQIYKMTSKRRNVMNAEQ